MASGQRYTPVAGFEERQRQSGYGSQDFGRGESNELNTFYDGNVPAAHRFSQTSYPAMQNANYARTDSAYSTAKDVGAGATGAGAGAGAAVAYDNPFSNNAAASGPQMSQINGPRPQSNAMAYQNIPSEQYWAGDNANGTGAGGSGAFEAASKSKKKWWIIGGVVAAIVIIAAVVGGVVGSQKSKSGSSGGNSSSGAGNSGTGNAANTDASNFDKDPRLHQSFWGFAYTPQGSVPPMCGATQGNVTRDIQLLSQITTRLRLYSANCNTTAFVLQAIKDTKVDMTVWPAVYIDSNEESNTAQMADIKQAIEDYGTDHIEGITVGNEFLLNNLTATGVTASTTSAGYTPGVDYLRSHIVSMNDTIKGMSLSKHLPIGVSDAGSLLNTYLAERIDYFMANVHPYFGALAINDAAAWTWQFFEWNNVEIAAEATNKPATFIAETGWPTESLTAADANSGAGSPQGDASVANLQTFLDTFVCQANANGTHYFYFEAFDEPWKAQYGGVEPFWGLFDKDRNLKNVTIPVCS